MPPPIDFQADNGIDFKPDNAGINFTPDSNPALPPLSDLTAYGARDALEQAKSKQYADGTDFLQSLTSVPSDIGTAYDSAVKGAGKVISTVGNIPTDVYNAGAALTHAYPPKDLPYQEGQSMLPEVIRSIPREFVKFALSPDNEPPAPPTRQALSTGLQNTADKLATGFTTPEGIATLPLFESAAGRSLMLGVQALQTPSMLKKTLDTLQDPDSSKADKWEAVGDAGANLAMSAALALHIKPSEVKAKLNPEQASSVVDTTKTSAGIPDNLTGEPNAINPQTDQSSVQAERSGTDTSATSPIPSPRDSVLNPAEPQPQGGSAPNAEIAQDAVGGGESTKSAATKAISRENNSRAAWGDFAKAVEAQEPDDSGIYPADASTDFLPPEPPIVDQPVNNPDSGQYGIAERVRDERAAAGQVDPVEPGQGISAADSVQRGRDLLTKGADSEAALSDFENTKAISADAVALTRARGEQLVKASRDVEQQFGIKSPQYQEAYKALSDWDARTKPMQTEWHKIGQAQQGATDIDTGTFTGLRRAFNDENGKDFTPKQAEKAQDLAAQNTKAQIDADTAKAKLFKAADKEPDKPAKNSVSGKVSDALNKAANDALARMKARRSEGRLMTGIDPADLADHVIYGASKIAKGVVDFSKWSSEMVKDLGDYVKPHLQDIWDASKSKVDAMRLEQTKALIGDHEPGTPFSTEQVKALWSYAKDYLNKGEEDFDSIRNKMATDLGMLVKDVTKGLTQSQNLKRLADDVWIKQRNARRLKEDAKLWLRSANNPLLFKIPRAVMQEAFNLKVMGHLSVGLGTHSPALFFQPKYWGKFFTNYGRMWKIGLSEAGHEAAMQDLTRRDNWTIARRAGLENDPFTHEEYNLKGLIEKVFPNLTHAGNRAYDVLKILRQDVFDGQWNKLPESMQTPQMASAIADSVNHVTGIVKKSPFGAASKVLFAPKLLASRFAWAFADPAKAVITGAKLLTDMAKGETNVTPEQKHFAVQQVREKATVVATMLGMLAANQAVLNASGSNQKINFDDPTKSDWLKFKAAGLDISFGNAMLTTLRLPFREAAILLNNTTLATGKKRYDSADRGTYEAIGEYFRNQLNPAVGDLADVVFQSDAQGRPLPWSRQPVPAYLKRQGITKPYTWGEWARDAVAPIPLEEPMKQVFDSYGMPQDQAQKWIKIIGTAIYMGGTGGRISEDSSRNSKK